MKFEIKNRWTGEAQFECEMPADIAGASYGVQLGFAVQKALEARANLAHAYLPHANLARADLAGAYLACADLARANLADADLAFANLAGANLADANLARANLADANLAGANLADANLADAKWRDDITIQRVPLQLYGLDYPVTILDHHMQIGCELHTLAEWRDSDNARIARMDGVRARKFWARHRDALLALAESDGRGVEPVAEEVA